MNDVPSVSVLIPTHNRSKYAISAVQSLLAIASDELQIVVHDTSNDACELRDFAATIEDRRLSYVYHADRLSMTENHEATLDYAKGEYICLIGDDDTVLPSILQAIEVARQKSANIVVPIMSANYCWPDFKTLMLGYAHAGKVYVSKFGGSINYVESSSALNSGYKNAFQGTDGLPKLYHGLVRRRLIEGIRRRDGRFFYGTSPDVSASISLCFATAGFYTWDYPVTLPGASGGSNTGRSAMNKHKGDFKTDPHMAAFKNVEWDDAIPKFFSVETVWANAALETLRAMGPADHLARFNLNRLYALCLAKHRDYRKFTNQAIEAAMARQDLSVSRLGIARESVGVFGNNLAAKAKRLRHPSPSNGKEALGPFENVFDAQRALVDFIKPADSDLGVGR